MDDDVHTIRLTRELGRPPDGEINVRLRFDEASRTWETYVPAFDLLSRGHPTQEEALHCAGGQLGQALFEGCTAAYRRERDGQRARIAYLLALASGITCGALACSLMNRAGISIGTAAFVMATAAFLVTVGAVLLIRRHARRPALPTRHKVGEDGWPVD